MARAGAVRHLIRETRLLGFSAVLLVLLAWEVYSYLDSAFAPYFPRVTSIAATFVSLCLSGELPHHVGQTLLRTFRGYLLGIVFGVSLGATSGLWRWVHALLGLTIELIRPTPVVAAIPIAILFLGMGDKVNIFVVALAATWPIYINTLQGVRRVSPELINTGRMFGYPRRRIIAKIIIPASLPFLVSGLRISLAISLIVAVISEMLVSQSGLGYFVVDTAQAFRISEMYAGVFATALVGYALNSIFVSLETRWMRWHKGFTAQQPA